MKKWEKNVSSDLSNAFGLLLDGWTGYGTATHYISIFAVYENRQDPGKPKLPLSGLSPLLNEKDLTTDSHISYFDYVLQIFGRTRTSATFLVGDNEALNVAIVKKLQVIFLRCYSHRSNLAVKQLVSVQEPEKIDNFA